MTVSKSIEELRKQFKPTTRDGSEVELYAVRGSTIFGRVGDSPEAWNLEGSAYSSDYNSLVLVTPADTGKLIQKSIRLFKDRTRPGDYTTIRKNALDLNDPVASVCATFKVGVFHQTGTCG